MMKLLASAVVLLSFTGCQRTLTNNLEFVVTPELATQTVILTCNKSTSDTCHFLFTKNGATEARIDINTGSTIAVHDIAAGSLYCAAIHAPQLDTCKPQPLPEKRSTEKRESSSTGNSAE